MIDVVFGSQTSVVLIPRSKVSNTQSKQLQEFVVVHTKQYFYFFLIPTWRVILTMIAVFLFTRWFRQYAILRVKPSAYGITFFRTSSWWLWCCGLWAELWFVVVGCTLAASVEIVHILIHVNLGYLRYIKQEREDFWLLRLRTYCILW